MPPPAPPTPADPGDSRGEHDPASASATSPAASPATPGPDAAAPSSLFGDPQAATQHSIPPYAPQSSGPGPGHPPRAGSPRSEPPSPGSPSPERADAAPPTPSASDATILSPGADRRHLPEKIGRYRIKRMLGFGGMGTVYEAIQDHPRRTVALKVMKPGVTSRSALKRFEYESQVLARLRHPGIAQVYDAGTYGGDDDGMGLAPFFAMEYIPGGQSITEYAKAKSLSIRQRLQLFVRVCDAVHHGHQKGVIHRDLKPANILIDTSGLTGGGGEALGQPKVIDFGVARTTDSDIAVTTLQTDVGQLIGTLQYMSPEQCAADPADIDTRSDVYGLGVILYELLAEKLPYDVTGVAVYDATRVVRDQLPARLTTINAHLGGDVETMVFKALDKDRERRYQSAAELARDINRYLAAEPISARRASVLYLLTVFTKRHKPVVLAAGGIFVALVVGIIATTMALVHANRETSRAEAALLLAEEETAQAKAIGGFLSELIQSVDPLEQRFGSTDQLSPLLSTAALGKPAPEVTIADALRAFTPRIDPIFDGKPLLQAGVRDIIGTTLHGTGLYQEALVQLRAAYNLRRTGLGEDHPDTLRSAVNLANTLRMLGQSAESNRLFLAGARGLTKALGEDHPDALYARSWIVFYDPPEAARTLRDIVPASERILGPSHPRTITAGGLLASTLLTSNPAEAETIAREMLDRAQNAFGQSRFQTAWCTYLVGAALLAQERPDAAIDFMRRALQLYGRLLGEDHPLAASTASQLAIALSLTGAHAEAVPILQRAVEAYHPAQPDAVSMSLRHLLAESLVDAGRPEEGEAAARAALDAALGQMPPNDIIAAGARLALGRALAAQGRFADAEQALERAYNYYASTAGIPPTATKEALRSLVALYEGWEKPDQLARIQGLLKALDERGEQAQPR